MKILTHPAIVALGATTLCLLALLGPFVAPPHLNLYHFNGSISPLALSIAFKYVGSLVDADNPIRMGTEARLAANLHLVHPYRQHSLDIAKELCRHGSLANATLVECVDLRWKRNSSHFSSVSFLATARVSRSLRTHAALHCHNVRIRRSVRFPLILGQMLWFVWRARLFNVPQPLHQRQTGSSKQHTRTRVIWVLLDELSYQQVYEQRFPGLKLDAFDQLAGQSTVFTHVIPTASFTEVAVPSLMVSRDSAVGRVSSSSSGLLSLHNARTNSWRPF